MIELFSRKCSSTTYFAYKWQQSIIFRGMSDAIGLSEALPHQPWFFEITYSAVHEVGLWMLVLEIYKSKVGGRPLYY